MKKWFYLYLFFCCSVISLHAQIVFKATVDKNPVALGDDVQITFEIDNGETNSIQPPSFANFTVTSGPNESTSMEIDNGHVTKSQSFSYDLQPKEVGTFTLGPASVVVGGNTLQSNSVKIDVVKGSSSSASSATPDLSKQIFIVASLDKSSAYEGEQVTLTYKLYTRVSVLQYGIDATPSYNGFWAEDINMERQQPRMEVYNGQQFQTYIVKKTALFASELGKLSIDPLKMKTVIQVEVKSKRRGNDPFGGFFNDPFFNQVQNLKYTVPSNAVSVDIKPLPDAGKPADFTGAVGRFLLQSKMDTGSLKTDDPIPMSITITGQGNLKLIDAPKLQLPSDFDSYPPKTTENINTKSYPVLGSKIIDYLFTPHNPGHYEIQPVNFSYFDPDTKQYISLHTATYNLNIKKGNGAPTIISSGLSKQDIKLLNQDIRYIKESTTLLQMQAKPFMGSGAFYVLILLPVVAFGGMFFWLNRERKLRGDVVGMKTRQARKVASQKLEHARQLLQNQDSKGFYNEISRALWGYISDKLTISTSEISRENVAGYLKGKHVSEATINGFFEIIDKCELALYAPIVAGSNMQQNYEKTADIISKLEQEIR